MKWDNDGQAVQILENLNIFPPSLHYIILHCCPQTTGCYLLLICAAVSK